MGLSSTSSSASFSQHLMCKDCTTFYDPIEPTTTFSPSDKQAVCVTTFSTSNTIEFRWYHRDNSSKAWISCYNWTENAKNIDGYPTPPYRYGGYLSIAGYWPGVYFPRAYKVDVYLDGLLSFSEFFEVTNDGLNSPRTCENVDANGQPANLKSRFTVGVDNQVSYYLRFDNMAYFDEETGNSHNFTTVWVQPNGTIYKTHSSVFSDYKDNDVTLNYWKSGLIPNDSISIDSTTPVGNWKVEVYVDSFYSNDAWTPYGPIATTPFIVGNESVANWTFMVYLDSDNSLANGLNISGQIHDLGIDVFLRLANVTSSPDFNIVVQMDRAPSQDERYGNWTGGKRFNVKQGMTPTAENAVPGQDLGDIDMGNPNTLKDFVNWTINNYPANFLFLVLWDHGSGCMGICYDVASGNDSLSLPKITQALSGIPAIIDGVLMDACGTSMLEVAYQIKDSANILVGPEGLGYGSDMPPYDAYLNNLSNNSSISPNAFAKEIVKDYIRWAYANAPWIQSATMTATDLTKMTSLAAAIDDFATTLKEKETLYHEQISLARSMTKGYPGPYQNPNGTYQTGYYVDLYDFASLVNATVPDEELRNDSSQVMTSIENAVIMKLDINEPGTNGLAVFFPDEKGKYDTFATIYEDTAFAINTPWDELVKYHLSGFVLTIKTMHSDMPVKVDEDVYNTTAEEEISVFLQPGAYKVNVTSVFSPEPDSQLVFVNWTDGNTSSTRTFNIVDSNVTAEAVYELQYPLVIETNFGGQNQTEPSAGKYWCNASSIVPVLAIAPSAVAGENYTGLVWIQKGARNSSSTDNPIFIAMNGPTNATAVWRHEYLLTVTSQYSTPTPTTGWFEAGTPFNGSITSPLSGSTGTQYVCTGWTGTRNVPSSGASLTTNFTLDQPSSIQWNWKTQYLLTVRTDPTGLNPQPSVYPAGTWYDSNAEVVCTAQQVNGYAFQQWTGGAGYEYPNGVNFINITMDGPYGITAHYVRAQAWWELLVRPDVMQTMLAVLGTTLTLGLVGGTWFRSRKRRNIVKAFLAEADDVYSRLKTYPKNCEDELYSLRNTVLEGLTDGKITQENYEIIDKRIDKYVAELSEALRRKRKAPAKRGDD